MTRNLTRASLARAIGVHVDSIKRHHARANPPPFTRRNGKPCYNAEEYKAWMASERLTGRPGTPMDPRLAAVRGRSMQAQARRAELETAALESKLVSAAEVAKRWAGMRAKVEVAVAPLAAAMLTLALNCGMPADGATRFDGEAQALMRAALQPLRAKGGHV